MPVDDDNIDVLLSKADVKLTANSLERVDLRNFMNTLRGIMLIPDPNDSTKKINPNDRGLRSKMTATRRQAVYDSSVSEATRLKL